VSAAGVNPRRVGLSRGAKRCPGIPREQAARMKAMALASALAVEDSQSSSARRGSSAFAPSRACRAQAHTSARSLHGRGARARPWRPSSGRRPCRARPPGTSASGVPAPLGRAAPARCGFAPRLARSRTTRPPPTGMLKR